MWKETDKRIDRFRDEYAFLSNFYSCPVVVDGQAYQNAEAAFQAQKCSDPKEKAAFQTLSGKEAKQRGRKVAAIPDWDKVRLNVMKTVVRNKFLQNHALAERLVSTGHIPLIEGNAWGDVFWGVDSRTGKGGNHLGKILMMVREELMNIGKPYIPSIKGRGVSLENRSVVEGSIIKTDDGVLRIVTAYQISQKCPDILEVVSAKRVMPDKLFFHIGREDRNGHEIFIGDIVLLQKKDGSFLKGVVVWNSECCRVDVSVNGISYPMFSRDRISSMDYEVIGNILEAPALADAERT